MDNRENIKQDNPQPPKRRRLFDDASIPSTSSQGEREPVPSTSQQPSLLSQGAPIAGLVQRLLDEGRDIPMELFTKELSQTLFANLEGAVSSGEEDDDDDDDDEDATQQLDEDQNLHLDTDNDDLPFLSEYDSEGETQARVQQTSSLSPQTQPSPSTGTSSHSASPSPPSSPTLSTTPSPSPPRLLPLDSYTWYNDRPQHVPTITFTGQRQTFTNLTNDDWTPYNVFRLLLTDGILTNIITETNVYGEYLNELARLTPRSTMVRWKDISRTDFLRFLGISFHMGTIKMARIQEYWYQPSTCRGLLHVPCFGRLMSRDRFHGILQAMHFARNPLPTEPSPEDKLYKIRPLINAVNDVMKDIYQPGKELSIDESMVLWRSRLSFRQYIKTKRHKYRMKLYIIAEPNGLALRFLLYAGSADSEVGGPGHATNVVKALSRDFTGQGHAIYTDNFYNSVALTRELLQHQTYLTGTLRKTRRHNPIDVTTHQLESNAVIQRYTTDGICVMKWKERRDILMISSEFSGDQTESTGRRGQTINKPEMVIKYNQSMSGIDRLDQMLAYYPSERKTLKWYKKLAMHIFQMMLVNAWVMYCTTSPNRTRRRKNFHDFRLEVIEKLIFGDGQVEAEESDDDATRNYLDIPPSRTAPGVSLRDHHPQTTDKSTASSRDGRFKKVMCRVCKRSTHFVCSGCPPDKYAKLGACPECIYLLPQHKQL